MLYYLAGISKRCDTLYKNGVLNRYGIGGLFDNDSEKWGTNYYGKKIEAPHFYNDVCIILTVKQDYYMEIIQQYMDLGYRRFLYFDFVNNEFLEKEYNFEKYDYLLDKERLILLYLEHNSYSGIRAIYYKYVNSLVDKNSFRIKFFKNEYLTEDYIYDLLTARYIITERAWDLSGKNIKAEIIQLWHGFPLKAMGNMQIGVAEQEMKIVHKKWQEYNYILSYGLNYTTFMCACYGTLRDKYLEIGMPRNDLLFITDGKANMESKFPAARGKKIALYMPTFRKIENGQFGILENGNDKGYIFYWDDFNVAALEQFCKENNLFFVFKLHPSDASKVCQWNIESEYIGVLTDEMLDEQCMYEFLNAADVLITDYSSVYFDYLLLDKPIIFTDNDADNYGDNRGFILEPLDFWRPGAVLHTMSDMYRELADIIKGKDTYKEARHALLPFVHKYQDGNATQRLLDFLQEGK